MTGTLYMVAVPIGNGGDLSPRALAVLEEADFILAENRTCPWIGSPKELLPFHTYDRTRRVEEAVARLLAGESCAFVADAGTPGVSDPGVTLAAACHAAGIPVRAIPGCSALAAAISVSGINCSRFCFEGFLSTNALRRRAHLELLERETRTIIFFEAPKKLVRTLADLLRTLGDRRLALCRDLSKPGEEVILTTLAGALEAYRRHRPGGELVLVIEGRDL